MKAITMTPQVFVPMIGQYDNIGDIVLRRPLMNWLRAAGELHVFVGKAPIGYTEGLGVVPGDIVYRSFRSWYAAAMRAAFGGRANYAFKPGEIQLSLPGMKEHLSVLPLLVTLRLRGGHVVRIGSGARNFAALPRALIKPSIALSELILWRDAKTAEYLGTGGVMPDLGFCEGDPVETMRPASERDVLVVSMRGDREPGNGGWVESVREYSSRQKLEIWVATQVLRDADRSQSLAEALGARLLDWDGTRHAAQEARLRELYQRARFVISDRLHVLIAAFTNGALPVGLMSYASDKIERHFAAAGIVGVTVQLVNGAEINLPEWLGELQQRREQMLGNLQAAREQLDQVRTCIVAKLADFSAATIRASSTR